MVTIIVTDDGDTMKIEISGHANYAPKGQDIVCAAISAIAETAVLGLKGVAETYPRHVRVLDKREG